MSHTGWNEHGIGEVRRIVVKVGSAVLAPGGVLDEGAIGAISADVARVRTGGVSVVLVSSGAVACGFRAMGLERMPDRIMDKQAAAAVGQQRLMRSYADAFASAGAVTTAQVLLTADDMDHRVRFLNARHTIDALLARGVLPIVNENDSVTFDEIRLGDNDRLSALVAGLVHADLLVILSSVRGLYERDADRVIPVVEDVEAARRHIGGGRSETGVGGMATKLDAAGVALAMGVPVVVTDGSEPGVIGRIIAGEHLGTLFPRSGDGVRGRGARKRWIGYSTRSRGSVDVDDGARRAIVERGASLLPKGIVGVEGAFPVGTVVEIRSPSGKAFARGLVSYSSDEIRRILGRATGEIAGVLGYAYSDEVVHRDDMLVRDEEEELR